MLIESKIKRPNGTVVVLDGVTYHFKPTDKIAAHVAEIKEPKHVDRFLAIPEGYRAYLNERVEEKADSQGDLLDANAPTEVKKTTVRRAKAKPEDAKAEPKEGK